MSSVLSKTDSASTETVASVEEQLDLVEVENSVYQFSGCQYGPRHNCEVNMNA